MEKFAIASVVVALIAYGFAMWWARGETKRSNLSEHDDHFKEFLQDRLDQVERKNQIVSREVALISEEIKKQQTLYLKLEELKRVEGSESDTAAKLIMDQLRESVERLGELSKNAEESQVSSKGTNHGLET